MALMLREEAPGKGVLTLTKDFGAKPVKEDTKILRTLTP
jgi:hypothetical protein